MKHFAAETTCGNETRDSLERALKIGKCAVDELITAAVKVGVDQIIDITAALCTGM